MNPVAGSLNGDHVGVDRDDAGIWRQIADVAAARPARPSISFRDGATYSREGIVRLAEQVSAGLEELGILPGERLAVMLGNRIEFVAAWLACLRSGIVLVPLNTSMRGPLLTHMLTTSQPSALLVESDLVPQVTTAVPENNGCRELVVVGQLRSLVPANLHVTHWPALLRNTPSAPVDASPQSASSILFTSGTTGPSKGVIWTETTARALAHGADLVVGYEEQDVSYICLPLFHANGLFVSLLPSLLAGGYSVIDLGFSASSFWQRVTDCGATVTSMLGIMAPLLHAREVTSLDRGHGLTRVMIVPAPASKGDFEKRFGVDVRTFYALTDAGMPIGFTGRDGELPPGACGRELPDWECGIVDPADHPLSVGQVGELVLRPRKPWIGCLGYWGDDSATVAACRNQWFHTGDLVSRDDAGWFYFHDRTKDAIRRSGENVSSFEVEGVLQSHPAVSEAAVFAVPSEFVEDEIMACIVVVTGEEVDAEAIAAYCREHLPYFAVPRFIEISPALPRTASQKIEKATLRQRGRTDQTVDVGRARRPGGGPNEGVRRGLSPTNNSG